MIIRDKSKDEEEVELTAEEEAELDEAVAELERGEYVTAEESLREVREILYRRDR